CSERVEVGLKVLGGRDAQGPKSKRLDLFHFIPCDLRAQDHGDQPGRQAGLPASGSLCRTIYLQRCRSQLVASGSYDANGRDNERIRHCNRQRILQASSVEPAGTDNTMSWLAIWRV